MGKPIVLMSSTGGAGRTTVSAQLSYALSDLNKKVLLVETQSTRPLGMLLEAGEGAVYNLTDLLYQRCEFSDSFVNVKKGFDLITGPEKTLTAREFPLFVKIISLFCNYYDYVVIDRPDSTDFKLESQFDDYVSLVILENEPVSLASGEKIASDLREAENNQAYVILNNFVSYKDKKIPSCNVDEIIDKTTLPLLGIVPYDEFLNLSRKSGNIPWEGRAFSAVSRIAKRICGEPEPLPCLKKI